MNNIFNPARFGRLFVKHTVEHYKNYLMSLIVLTGVLVLGGSFLVFLIPGSLDSGFQSALFIIILLLAGTIFTSTVFADMGDNKKAVLALTLPASHLEKYLVVWCYSFLIFLLVFTGSFYLIVTFLLSLKPPPGQTEHVFNVFDNQMAFQALLLYALLHSITLLGAILFKKLHFIKTAFGFFIYIAILIIANKLIMSALLNKDVVPTPPFGNLRFIEKGREVVVGLSDQHGGTISMYFIIAIAFIFWVAAYYRLKEKQV